MAAAAPDVVLYVRTPEFVGGSAKEANGVAGCLLKLFSALKQSHRFIPTFTPIIFLRASAECDVLPVGK